MRRAQMDFRQGQRGVAAVEFGILIIPLSLMLFGLTEYGRAIYQYNTLVKSTRDAVRYLTTVAPGAGDEVAKCLVLWGKQTSVCDDNDPDNPTPGVLAPYMKKSMVSVSNKATNVDGNAVNLVTVSVAQYEFQSLINFPVGALSIGAPNITFGAISNTMRQKL
jgi:hypothetical protein